MKRRTPGALFPCLLLAGLLCLTSQAFGQVKLNYSIFFPASHRNSLLAADWAKEIEKSAK